MIGEEERVLARLQDRGRLVASLSRAAARLKEPVRRVVDVLHLETDTRAVSRIHLVTLVACDALSRELDARYHMVQYSWRVRTLRQELRSGPMQKRVRRPRVLRC